MRRVIVLLGLAGATLLVAVPTASARVANRDRPPANDVPAVAKIFDPALKPLGLHVVRAALEPAGGGHVDPNGTHFAVYVQPIDQYTADDYRANFSKVAAIFVPKVFDQWSAVKTFDVCQEPVAAFDPRPEPPPITQLLLSRKVADQYDWDTMTIRKATKAAKRTDDPKNLYVFVNTSELLSPRYQDASSQ